MKIDSLFVCSQNTRDDNHRKLAEIKTAAAQSPMSTRVSNRRDIVLSPRQNRGNLSPGSTTPVSGNISLASERGTTPSKKEVEEVEDDSPSLRNGTTVRKIQRKLPSERIERSPVSEDLHSSEKRESIVELIDEASLLGDRSVSERTETSVIPEDLHSSVGDSIVEVIDEASASGDNLSSMDNIKISEELSKKPYTLIIPRDEIVPEVDARISNQHLHFQLENSLEETPKYPKDSNTAGYSYEDDSFEKYYTETINSTSLSIKSPKIHSDRGTISESISSKKSLSISEHLTSQAKESFSVSEHHTRPAKERLSVSEHLRGPAEEIPSISEHFKRRTRPGEKSASVADQPSYTDVESDTSVSDHSSLNRQRNNQSKSEANAWIIQSDRRKRSAASNEISEKGVKSGDDRQRSSMSEQQQSDGGKSSVSAKRKAPEQSSPPFSSSPSRGSVMNETGSRSEALSVAEEIPSDNKEDIPMQSQELVELHFGDNLEGKNELNGNELAGLDLTGLDESGLTQWVPEKRSSDGFSKTAAGEYGSGGLFELGFDKVELRLPQNNADVIEGDKRTKKTTISRSSLEVGVHEQCKESTNEQQYSDVFDYASIPKEISDVGDEFFENASGKGENFAEFKSSDQILKSGNEIVQRTDYESRDHISDSHSTLRVDNITDEIYEDIIADSRNIIKSLKSRKLHILGKLATDESGSTRMTKCLDTARYINQYEGEQGMRQTDTGIITCDADTDRENLATSDDTGTARKTIGPIRLSADISGQEGTRMVTKGYSDEDLSRRITDGQSGGTASVEVIPEHGDTDMLSSGEPTPESRHFATDDITKDLLADAIMQMIDIKRRKKIEHDKKTAAVESQTIESKQFPSTTDTLPDFNPGTSAPTDTVSLVSVPGIEDYREDVRAINNALMIAKTNQILDDDALRDIDNDIAGLLGTPVDDEDEFHVNVTNFTSDIPSDNETSLPEYSPMIAVPHSAQEIQPIVDSVLQILNEQRRLGRSVFDCTPQVKFLAGENENEPECPSIQSYRHLVFDLTKEVFLDTLSQNESATRPSWAKAWRKGRQKLSRHFKRWKSDGEVRSAVLERVINLIGLGAPRATMATIPRKTPVRGNKKDNVDAILIEELRQEEPLWTDYEEDETSVKFQVADAILNMMLEDTVRVFNAIHLKKHIPDEVMVI